MDILKSKTVTGYAGSSSVNSGLALAKIIKVSRQGTQKDYIALAFLSSLTTDQWTHISTNKRIIFSEPFADGNELIHIIYKL